MIEQTEFQYEEIDLGCEEKPKKEKIRSKGTGKGYGYGKGKGPIGTPIGQK